MIDRSASSVPADERMRCPCADIILARVSKMTLATRRANRCNLSFNRVVHLQGQYRNPKSKAQFLLVLGGFDGREVRRRAARANSAYEDGLWRFLDYRMRARAYPRLTQPKGRYVHIDIFKASGENNICFMPISPLMPMALVNAFQAGRCSAFRFFA